MYLKVELWFPLSIKNIYIFLKDSGISLRLSCLTSFFGCILRGGSFSAGVLIKLFRHENSGIACICDAWTARNGKIGHVCPPPPTFLLHFCTDTAELLPLFPKRLARKNSVTFCRVPVCDITSCFSAAAAWGRKQ